MKSLLTLLLALPVNVLAASAQDDYYSRDIFQAIHEARKHTHHYDYSNALRYNRSTSQSIRIPRLLNQEMAQTIVETPDIIEAAGIPDNPDAALQAADIYLRHFPVRWTGLRDFAPSVHSDFGAAYRFSTKSWA